MRHNFNLNRSIDLSRYLPNMYRGIREFKAIIEMENPVIAELWKRIENIFDDQFIEEATEKGLSRYERMFGINPAYTDTILDRRFRLKAMYNNDAPYTRRRLELQLRELCGDTGYSVEFDTAECTINVKVALSVQSQVCTLSDLLERVVPYNMVINVTLMYNKWHQLATKSWGSYVTETWENIKQEELLSGEANR